MEREVFQDALFFRGDYHKRGLLLIRPDVPGHYPSTWRIRAGVDSRAQG